MSKFGLTEKYSKFGLAGKYAQTSNDPAAYASQVQSDAYQRALGKLKNGGVLTAEEAAAVARVKSDQRAMSAIAAALQPLLAPSDIIKGVASDVKADITSGQPFTHTEGGNRGMAAAASHVTYGLTERLPGLAGAREAGITGAALLKGTKYEGDSRAALLVELLSDPSLVLGGAGLAVKGAGMAAKYASLAEFASTASGANALRDMAAVANRAGGKLLHLSDEATGIPAAARTLNVPLPNVGKVVQKIAPKSPVGAEIATGGVSGGVKGVVSRIADTTMPAAMQRVLGVRTYGDAFLTPDQKAAAYTANQLKRDAFRDTTRLDVDNLGSAITRSAVDDAQIVGALTKGLGKTDAAEVNRLFGQLGTTTDPAVAAEVFRKLNVISTRVGKNLEPAMVDAFKAADRVSQVTLGNNLAARGLPAVIDPAVTRAVQQAQTGADLLPHIGGYKTLEGRPRGVLMTQYQGRGNLDATISKIEDAPPVKASVNLNDPAQAPAATQKISSTLDQAAAELPELPPAPVAPVGVRPAAAPPGNPAETLDRILAEPGGVKPAASLSDAAPPVPLSPALGAAPAPVRSPAETVDELFGSKTATVSDVPAVANDLRPAPKPSTADLFGEAPNTASVASDLPTGGKISPAPREGSPLVDDQLRDWYGEEGSKVAARVTPADQAAIQDYVSANFRPINMLLRDSAAFDEYGYTAAHRLSAEQTIANLDEALSRYTIQRPLTVYRGIGGDYGIDLYKLAKAGKLTGTDLADLSYASTTVSRKVADQFGQHFVVQIDVPAGTRGMPLHRLGDASEQELLLARGTRYRVKGVEQQGDRMVARAELLPPDPNTGAPFGRPALGDKTRYIPASAVEQPPKFDLSGGRNLGPKTPAETIDAILNPPRPQAGYAAPTDLARTPQADLKAAANVTQAPEQLVSKTIPVTYRTVSIDPSALDWASLPDQAARRAVANVLGGELTRTANGAYKYSKDLAEVPLSHPVISHYFDDATLEAARFTGTGYGERTIKSRQTVPDWYDPKDPRSLSVQRDERDAMLGSAGMNDLPQMERTANELNTGNLDTWIVGDAYASSGRPLISADFPRAANDYSQRVLALNGRPATPAEVFGYKMQLARYNQQARLRTVSGDDITRHLTDFYAQHPEATLYEAVVSASRQFGLGRGGAMHLQDVLRAEESGFVRQMSSLEQARFAQYLKAGQRSSIPGGSITSRMLRNPEEVSAQFKQVFEQDYNGMQLLTDQVQRGTSAIMQAEQQQRYFDYLTQTGQHLSARQIVAMNARPAHLMSPDELRLAQEITFATETSGRAAGWTIMDRNYGPFKIGDAVPWWAYYDIFHASSVADAAVSGRILGNGGWEVYDRLWASQNATLLSSPSSIVTDQIGQLMQMVMYGVTPDEIINGLIQRAVAKPAALEAMRESGIASAKLESNLSVDGAQLRALARRLGGEDDMTRMQRVVDGIIRFREYGSGVDRAALSNPAAKIAADVTSLGSAKLFQLRSAMSDLQREALYMHYTSTGLTPTRAAAAANEVLMDMRLAPAYAKVVGRYWPFFRWIAMSGPRSVVNVLRKPSISYAWNRAGPLSDVATEDGQNDARRILTRPNSALLGTVGNGWINLGAGLDERDGTRVYLDVRNWDPNSTGPQLLDWSGTKVGAVSLPWYVSLVNGLQNGVDRNGLPVYRDALNGQPGGGAAAFQADPNTARREAVAYTLAQFAPSYALGGTRAANLASAIIETAKLPDDGSKDITIAKTLMGTELGRGFVNVLQHGWQVLEGVPLTGNRGSAYSAGPPSMARAATSYLFPVQGVQVDPRQQGTAAAALNVGLLGIQNWQRDEVNRLKNMQAGGATPQMMRAAQENARRELQRRMQLLNVTNLVTRAGVPGQK